MSENQQELFTLSPQTGTFQPKNFEEIDKANHGVVNSDEDPNPGPHVDLLDRNEQFERLLTALGSLSRVAGLETIADGGSSRRILENRYDDVDAVVGKATENKKEHLKEAKQAFARMYGLKDLSESDFIKTEEIAPEQILEDVYRSFDQQVISFFGDSKGADNRKNMRKWLNYQRKILREERTRKPAVSLPVPPETKYPTVDKPNKVISVDEPHTMAERRDIEKIAKIESLQGHRIAGPGSRTQARLNKISNDDSNVLVTQGSNGSAQIVVPKKYAEAVARALDNGAKESDINKIIRNEPVMKAKLSGNKTGRARPAVRF